MKLLAGLDKTFELMIWSLILPLFRKFLEKAAKEADRYKRYFQIKSLNFILLNPNRGFDLRCLPAFYHPSALRMPIM
jgi:hypothetical protein